MNARERRWGNTILRDARYTLNSKLLKILMRSTYESKPTLGLTAPCSLFSSPTTNYWTTFHGSHKSCGYRLSFSPTTEDFSLMLSQLESISGDNGIKPIHSQVGSWTDAYYRQLKTQIIRKYNNKIVPQSLFLLHNKSKTSQHNDLNMSK